MAKRARRNGGGRNKRASGVAVAMARRYGTQQTNHGNKRKAHERDRQAWRKEHAADEG